MTINIHLTLPLSLLLAAAAGCSGPRQIPLNETSREIVRTELRDSTVLRYVDIQVPLPLESSRAIARDSSHLETSLAESDVYVDSSGIIRHTIRNKDTSLTAKVPEKEQYRTEHETESNIHEKIVEVEVAKPLSAWKKFWIWSGAAAWLALTIYLAWRIVGVYFRLR